MSIYCPKTVDLKWDAIIDVDVDGMLEGKVKPTKDIVLHVCQARIDTDQPEASDTFSLLHLWRVMQVLLETTAYESLSYSRKLQQMEQQMKAQADEAEAKIKALTEELTKIKEENAVLKGEKFGIVQAPPTPEEKAPLLTEEEGKALQDKVRKVQEQYTAMMKQKTAIAEELQQLKALAANDAKDSEIQQMASQIADLTAKLQTKDQELEGAQKALEGKINESTQFKNMKAMLAQKNELLRDVRDRLKKYEAEPPGAPDED